MASANYSLSHIGRIYALEAQHEFMTLLRTPSYVLPSLLFPVMFYTLFGVLMSGAQSSGKAAEYLLASYGVFGIIGAALFGLGVTTASDRERGFFVLKRALPMPRGALLFARLVSAMLLSSLISVLLAAIAATCTSASLVAWQWFALFFINVLGALPFAAIGLWIGTMFNGRAAPVVINLIYLPMAFLSGLWMPLTMMPAFVGKLAPLWPSWHLGQIALKVVGQDSGTSILVHLSALAMVTVIAFVFALRRLDARL
jgi:ABC-2 type transport system permease protein